MNIFCIQQNYFLHTRERSNNTIEPAIFLKPESALLQADAPFNYPAFANELFGGCELVLHISKSGKDIEEQRAGTYYDSISAGINFTALEPQDGLNEEELTWGETKAWDHSCVAGNWIPAADFKNKKDINFCWYKNRELVQLGNSGLMIYDFDKIVSVISKAFPVVSGDLIFTGTPAGISRIGHGDKLEVFIEDDSLLEFEIE